MVCRGGRIVFLRHARRINNGPGLRQLNSAWNVPFDTTHFPVRRIISYYSDTFSRMIPLQLTRLGQPSRGCKRTFKSSSLPRIGRQEGLDLNPLDYRLWSELEGMACHRAHTLTWKESNNIWSNS
ncbi:unnamed protein product [Nezara viridula]|uniref:Uncharacterized protein n=1 Tax=Nezara viridula TaxID=85310 RepID=A0A9P0HAY3_NEZVI|nr:unnamed protein product [Nezara viridula]